MNAQLLVRSHSPSTLTKAGNTTVSSTTVTNHPLVSPRRMNYLPHRLASVEVALIFHSLDRQSAWSLLRTCRTLLAFSTDPFIWRCTDALLIEQDQLESIKRKIWIQQGQVPIKFMWEGEHASSIMDEIAELAQLSNLRELCCCERRGLTDQHLEQLVAQASITRTLRKVSIGGFHNSITGRGLNILCQGLPNLTALSLDLIRERVEEGAPPPVDPPAPGPDVAEEGAPPVANDAAAAVELNQDEEDESARHELLSGLLFATGLKSLQITKWMAEELTPQALTHITQCTQLESLFLENLESFASEDLRHFFSSSIFARIKFLTLSYVHLTQLDTYLAFFEEGSSDTSSYAQPRKGIFDQMVSLELIQLLRCRNIHKMIPQLVLLPNVKTIVIRGLLDSWGVELPKRDELLHLIHHAESKELSRVIILVHTSTPQLLENYRAQVSAVSKVDFRDGNVEMNPIKF